MYVGGALTTGLYGLIIFPDIYTQPTGVDAPDRINEKDAPFTTNEYTITQWKEMEKAGAVFLPAAGDRWNGSVGSINIQCFYWSSSDYYGGMSTHAKNLRIGNNDLMSNSQTQRHRGNCVRLVHVATESPSEYYLLISKTSKCGKFFSHFFYSQKSC